MIWPDFCSVLIVGRLAPLGLHNTRFRSVPVSRSPRTGADASSSTTRPTGTSPIPGPSNPGRACVARRARSCTRRRRSRPWRCRTSRRPCRPREACRTPRPWWCTRGRCTARHGRNGARDRPCRHARRPMTSPVPAPAVYGQINVYGVTTKSERHKRSYWTRTADGNGIGGRKAPVPYGS